MCAYRKELYEKIKASTTAQELAQSLERLKSMGGEASTAAARETIELLHYSGTDYASRQQFKKAATQFYTGARIIRDFKQVLGEGYDEKQWIDSAASYLEASVADHVAWGDVDSGSACLVISILLKFLVSNNWDQEGLLHPLDEFVKKADFDDPKNRFAPGIVRIPYELSNGVKNLDFEALTNGDSYIQSYLMQSPVASLFTDAINEAYQLSRTKLMEKIKLPQVRAALHYSQDIVFDEDFSLKLTLENVGEGKALKTQGTIHLPEGMVVSTGEPSVSLPEMESGQKRDLELTVRCPRSESQEKQIYNISVQHPFH